MECGHVSSGGRRHPGGSRTGGGGSMKAGTRHAVLLAVVLAAALSLLGARATPAAHAGAKVSKTWAQLEKEALTFRRKSSDNLAIAVPQGSGGDAYHMYPFFSGLGGFVFGHAKNGALQASKLGVANPVFLKNASLIDRWN